MGNQDNRPVAYTYANVPPMVSRSSMSLASVSNNNPYEVNIKIMIAAIVVLFSVILFILALHLYAKWFWKNHQFGSRRRRQQQIQQHFDDDPLLNNPAFGLDKALLEALPTFVFKQGEPASIPTNGADCCAVCLCEFQEGDAGRVLPKCAHAFHTECIDMWLYCHTTCPLCRAGIVSAPWEAPAKTDLAAVDLRVLDSVASPAIVLSLEGLLMNSEPGDVQTSGSLRHLLEANEAGVAGGLDADEQQQQPFTTGSSKSTQECGSVCGDQRGSHRLLVIEPVLPQATATTGSTSAGGCSQAAAAAAPKSPKSRWRNLRRMLSRDRRIAPASSSSSSASWAAAAAGVECDQAEGRVVVLLVE